jgi:hypothetical protein
LSKNTGQNLFPTINCLLDRGKNRLFASVKREFRWLSKGHQRGCTKDLVEEALFLDRRLGKAGHSFKWVDIKQDLKSLQEITIEEKGKRLAIRSECRGICGKVFQSVGLAIPPTIREV